jgi:hypothetical protein
MESLPAPRTFPRCKIFRGNNVCNRYELSISGKNVLSCEEKDTCTDLFVPAKCELYYQENEIREFDINELGYSEKTSSSESESVSGKKDEAVPAAAAQDEAVAPAETKKQDQDSAAPSVNPAPIIPSNC